MAKQAGADSVNLHSSGFGTYLRELRLAIGPRQKDVCQHLRAFGLRTSIKDIFEWENGRRHPSSVAKAALMQVLDGSSVQADELLIADVQLDAAVTAALAVRAQERIEQLLEQNVAAGKEKARQWIQLRLLESQETAVDSIPTEMIDEARSLLASLYSRNSDLADAFLRYGRFLVVESQKM